MLWSRMKTRSGSTYRSRFEHLEAGDVPGELAFEIDLLGWRTLAVADAALLDSEGNEAAVRQGGEQAPVGLGEIVLGIEGIVDAVSADAADQQHRRSPTDSRCLRRGHDRAPKPGRGSLPRRR
jgi:hypothetical protein